MELRCFSILIQAFTALSFPERRLWKAALALSHECWHVVLSFSFSSENTPMFFFDPSVVWRHAILFARGCGVPEVPCRGPPHLAPLRSEHVLLRQPSSSMHRGLFCDPALAASGRMFCVPPRRGCNLLLPHGVSAGLSDGLISL